MSEQNSAALAARKTDGGTGVFSYAVCGATGRGWFTETEEHIFRFFPHLKERMNVAADYLSGGKQQMVAVARALSGNIKLLLLDKQFEGLAPAVVLEPTCSMHCVDMFRLSSSNIISIWCWRWPTASSRWSAAR
jgi:ABC-type branched-subunit amino acid transport system ATPase component